MKRAMVPLLLLLLCVGLGTTALWLRTHPKLLALPDAPPQGKPAAVSVVAMAMPDAAAVGEIQARPLFSPTRRPAPPPAAPAPEPVAVAPPPVDILQLLSLAGLAVSDEHVALLRRGAEPQLLRAREGDLIEGWTVDRIGPDGVRFTNGAVAAVLRFPRLNQPSASPGPMINTGAPPGQAATPARLFSPGG